VPLENLVLCCELGFCCGISAVAGAISRCCCRWSTGWSGACSACWRCCSAMTCPKTPNCSCSVTRTRCCAVRPEAGRGGITPTGFESRHCPAGEPPPMAGSPSQLPRRRSCGGRHLVARKWTYTDQRRLGPSTGTSINRLITRMARENPTWGYRNAVDPGHGRTH
jgi:hypothetical protein